MNIDTEHAVAQIEDGINKGTLVPGVNLSNDIRGIIFRNENPNRDTELLTALDSLPFALEIVVKEGEEKFFGMTTFREQLARFVDGARCAHTVVADKVCLGCGKTF